MRVAYIHVPDLLSSQQLLSDQLHDVHRSSISIARAIVWFPVLFGAYYLSASRMRPCVYVAH